MRSGSRVPCLKKTESVSEGYHLGNGPSASVTQL
jgi:hypothetical protein